MLALAVVGAPLVVVMATPGAAVSTPLAMCTGGEEEDVYTTSCVPMLVPNSPDDDGFTTNAANPDIPEIDGVPCTGHDSGACIGSAEAGRPKGRSRYRGRPSAPARSPKLGHLLSGLQSDTSDWLMNR